MIRMLRVSEWLYLLLLTLLPSQLGLHFWPRWTVILGRRVDYLSPTLYVTDIVIALFCFSVFWDTSLRSRLKHVYGHMTRQWMLVVLFLLFVGINIGGAQEPFVTLYGWVKIFEYLLLLFCVVILRPAMFTTVIGFSIGVVWSSLLGLGQFVSQSSLGGLFWLLGERQFRVDTPGIARTVNEVLRPYATFPHPNVLGGYLALSIPLIFFYRAITRKYILDWLLMGCGLVALYVAQSRSAWVAGIVVFLGLWCLNRSKAGSLLQSPISRILIGTIVVSLGILMYLWISRGDESVVVRLELMEAAKNIFFSSPIFGVGLGNFLVQLPDVLVSRTVYFLQPVHSVFLLAFSEIGIVGILLFISVCWRVRKYLDMKNPFLWLVFGLLLVGLVDHYPTTLQQGQLMLVIFLANGFVTRYDS